jgi:ParB/RepB/Spo0J family partition protein
MNAPESLALQPQTLDLALLAVSRTEAQAHRRKRFKPEVLEELASTIRQHGVIQPILVRPITNEMRAADPDGFRSVVAGAPSSECEYEIIAGERRALASVIAEMQEIAVIVRDLDDSALAELQLIENIQRESLHELEEAIGYQTLMAPPYSLAVEEIMAKVGKSRRMVYARLELLKLIPKARDAFYDDKLNASTAQLVASVIESEQEKALAEIVRDNYEIGPMSFREAREHIRRNYQRSLMRAPFQLKVIYDLSEYKVEAPTCVTCTKRTRAKDDLFGDVNQEDMCMDSVCFNAKRDAQAALDAAEEEQSNANVNEETNADQLLATAKTTATQGQPAAQMQAWGGDPDKMSEANKAVQSRSTSAADSEPAGAVSEKAKQAERAARIEYETRLRIFNAMRAAMEARMLEAGGIPDKADVWEIGRLALEAYDGGDGAVNMMRVRGLSMGQGGIYALFEEAYQADDIPALFMLLWETTVADSVDYASHDRAQDRLLLAADRLGVDSLAIGSEVLGEVQAQEKASEEAAKPKKAKKGAAEAPEETAEAKPALAEAMAKAAAKKAKGKKASSAKKGEAGSEEAPAAPVKAGEPAAAPPKKAKKTDDRGFWPLAEVEALVPKDCATDADGIFIDYVRFRATLPGKKVGSVCVDIASDSTIYACSGHNTMKGHGYALPIDSENAYSTLEGALSAFLTDVANERRAADQGDKIGKLLEAGLMAGDKDKLLPKIFELVDVHRGQREDAQETAQ